MAAPLIDNLLDVPQDALYLIMLDLDYVDVERLGATCRTFLRLSRHNAIWFAQFQAIRAKRTHVFDVEGLNYFLLRTAAISPPVPLPGMGQPHPLDAEGWSPDMIFTTLTWRPRTRQIREIRLAFHFDRILAWLEQATHGVHLEFVTPPLPPAPPQSSPSTAAPAVVVRVVAAQAAAHQGGPALNVELASPVSPPHRFGCQPPHDFLLSRRTLVEEESKTTEVGDEKTAEAAGPTIKAVDDCTLDTRKMRAVKLSLHGEEVSIQVANLWSRAFSTLVTPLTNPKSSFTHRSNDDPMTLVLDHDESKTHHILRMPLKRLVSEPMEIWRSMFRMAWIDDMRSEQALVTVENLSAFYETKFATQLGYETVQGQLSDEDEHKTVQAVQVYKSSLHSPALSSATIFSSLDRAHSIGLVPSAASAAVGHSAGLKANKKAKAQLLGTLDKKKRRKERERRKRAKEKNRKALEKKKKKDIQVTGRMASPEEISSSSSDDDDDEEEEKEKSARSDSEDSDSDGLAFLRMRRIERYPIVTPYLSVERIRQVDRDKPGLSVRCRICQTPVAIGDSEPFLNEATSSLMPIANQGHRYCSTRCLRHSLNRFGIERVPCANPRCGHLMPISSALGVVMTTNELDSFSFSARDKEDTRDLVYFAMPVFSQHRGGGLQPQMPRGAPTSVLMRLFDSRHLQATYEALGTGFPLFAESVRNDMTTTYEFLASNRAYWNNMLRTMRSNILSTSSRISGPFMAGREPGALKQLELVICHWLAQLPPTRAITVLGDELQGVQNVGWQDRLHRYQLFRARLSTIPMEQNWEHTVSVSVEEENKWLKIEKRGWRYKGDIHAGTDLPFATLGLGLPVVQTFFPMPHLRLVTPTPGAVPSAREAQESPRSSRPGEEKMASLASLSAHQQLETSKDYELTAMRSKFKAYCSSWCAHEPKAANPYRPSSSSSSGVSSGDGAPLSLSRCCNPKCKRVFDIAAAPISMECLELIRVVITQPEVSSSSSAGGDEEEEDVRASGDPMDLDDPPPSSSSSSTVSLKRKREPAKTAATTEEAVRREELIGYVCDEHCVDAYFKAKVELYKLQRAHKRAKLGSPSVSPGKH
jgi:hypothetical protein